MRKKYERFQNHNQWTLQVKILGHYELNGIKKYNNKYKSNIINLRNNKYK